MDLALLGEIRGAPYLNFQRQGDVLTCDLWRTMLRSLGGIALQERCFTVTFRQKNREDFFIFLVSGRCHNYELEKR